MATGSDLDQEKKRKRWANFIAVIGPVLLVLFFWGLAVKWWTDPHVYRRPVRGWLSAFAQAELLREKGDLYGASSYYAMAAQWASSADDWEGLLAAACGLQKLGDVRDPGMNSLTILIRAMLAAERKQSTEGLEAVAKAFRANGERFASLALSRIQKGSSGGRQMAKELKKEPCWPRDGKK